MPKIRGTIKQRKNNLHYRISPEGLKGVFRTIPGENLDARTIEAIKKQYEIFYNSWIKDEADKFLLSKSLTIY